MGQLDEVKKNGAVYLRRFKKEKKLRRRLQDEPQFESEKRARFEEAINCISDKQQQQQLQIQPKLNGDLGDPVQEQRSMTDAHKDDQPMPLLGGSEVGGLVTRPNQLFPFSNGGHQPFNPSHHGGPPP